MSENQTTRRLVRFGAFEADVQTGELRKEGVKLKFSGQPFQVLAILLERPGDVVTREELQKRLWPDTFVDFEHNLNTAVNKIREVLGDSAESPVYVETLPRRGYRFIAPVETELPLLNKELTQHPIEPSTRWRRPFGLRVAILGSAAILAIGLVIWLSFFRPAGTPKVVRFIPITHDGQGKEGPIRSDGVRIYFTEILPDGRDVIAQVSVKGGDVTQLSVPLRAPFVLDLSRDGTELLIANQEGPGGSDRNSIWIQPVAGGSPLRVGAILTRAAAFGPDGTSIIYSQGHDVYTANRDGSSPRKLFAVEYNPGQFRFSPDGKVLRFIQVSPSDGIFLLTSAAADGTGVHTLFHSGPGEWTPDGRYFISVRRDPGYTRGHLDLWAHPEWKPFPWARQNNESIRLTSGPFEYWWPLPAKDGNEIFTIAWNPRVEVIRYDSRSHEFVPFLGGISAEGLAFSPDHQWVTYTTYPDGTLWRSRVDGSERLQLTSPPMQVVMPRWSPDGRQIAFNATLPLSTWNIYVISSAGGAAERLVPSQKSQLDAEWSPDGKSLIFGSAIERDRAIYLLDLSSRKISTLPGSSGLFSPHWSPDGRYIAGMDVEFEKLMLFDTSTRKWKKPCDCRVAYPMWSRDGKYLYFQYYPGSDGSFRIVRLRIGDGKIENVAETSNIGRITVGTWGQWFGLAPDDSPLLARDISTQEIYALEMKWP
jgi:Tol biopolymer transport system component/DNA-binding winged helix-turn-helix (wHTH) protein